MAPVTRSKGALARAVEPEGRILLLRPHRGVGEGRCPIRVGDTASVIGVHVGQQNSVEVSRRVPLAAGLPLPVISAFMAQHPEIELDLDFSDRVSDVIQEGLDVVIRGGDLKDSRLVSKRLGAYRLCLVAAPHYLEAHGTPSKPADLVNHACLHYRYPTSGKLDEWPLPRAATGSSGLRLPLTMVSSSLIALLHFVEVGRGIACLPDFAVKDALADGRLRSVLDPQVTRTIHFQIVWPSSKQMSPKVRAFVDFVVDRFGRELATGSIKRRKAR